MRTGPSWHLSCRWCWPPRTAGARLPSWSIASRWLGAVVVGVGGRAPYRRFVGGHADSGLQAAERMTSPCSVSRWLRCDKRQRGASKPPGLRGGLCPAESGGPWPLVSRLGAGAPRTSTSGGWSLSWLVSAAAHRSRPAPGVKDVAALRRYAVASRSLTPGALPVGFPARLPARTASAPPARGRRLRGRSYGSWAPGHDPHDVLELSSRRLRCDERQRGASKPPGLRGGLCPAGSGGPGPLVSRLGAGAPRTSTSGGSVASWLVSAAAHRSRPAPGVKDVAALRRYAVASRSLTPGPCRSAFRRGCRHGLRPRRPVLMARARRLSKAARRHSLRSARTCPRRTFGAGAALPRAQLPPVGG